MRTLLSFLFSVIFLLAPGAAIAAALPQDIYVWQRQWSDPVRDALARANDVASGWRVLVAESDAPGRFKTMAVDWAALARTGKPLTAVIRIDGQLPINDEFS